jgi:hypothetical protein
MGKLITSVSTLHQYQPLAFSLIKFATIALIITGTVSLSFLGREPSNSSEAPIRLRGD